jgi:ribonuclease VapC
VIVLDASALIALMRKEPGRERVEREFKTSAISSVNLSEALSKFVEEGGDAEQVAAEIAKSGCEIVPASTAHAIRAAKLRPVTKSAGLSLGDRMCLALAQERSCPVLTADRSWAKIGVGVQLEFVR